MKILFICHGNICRSTMAEMIFNYLSNNEYEVESKATSTEEIGNPIYPPARSKLIEKGIPITEHFASQVTKEDYNYYDLLIIMDENNRYNLSRIIGEDKLNKVHLLMEYTSNPREVSDPWYTRDFERAYQDIYEGCLGLLDTIKKEV